jgi:hypothetical protein
VDSVPDQLLLRKSGSAGNRTRDLEDTVKILGVGRFFIKMCPVPIRAPLGYFGKFALASLKISTDTANNVFK